jgi:hypothetical protein
MILNSVSKLSDTELEDALAGMGQPAGIKRQADSSPAFYFNLREYPEVETFLSTLRSVLHGEIYRRKDSSVKPSAVDWNWRGISNDNLLTFAEGFFSWEEGLRKTGQTGLTEFVGEILTELQRQCGLRHLREQFGELSKRHGRPTFKADWEGE